MDDYQIRYLILVDDVVKVCRFIVEKRFGDKLMIGIWYWSGREFMIKYFMVLQMVEMFGLLYSYFFFNLNLLIGIFRFYNIVFSCLELELLMDDGGVSMCILFK